MAQCLRAENLAENQGSIPSAHTVAHNHLLPQLQEIPCFFFLASTHTRHACCAHTHMQAKIFICIK